MCQVQLPSKSYKSNRIVIVNGENIIKSLITITWVKCYNRDSPNKGFLAYEFHGIDPRETSSQPELFFDAHPYLLSQQSGQSEETWNSVIMTALLFICLQSALVRWFTIEASNRCSYSNWQEGQRKEGLPFLVKEHNALFWKFIVATVSNIIVKYFVIPGFSYWRMSICLM